MILTDLDRFQEIVIQVHDNPDADAVGSGYALYKYFQSRGKDVRLIYGGSNIISKSNMKLLLSELQIPLEYVQSLEAPELLLTVDCQYGEGNVQRFEAQNVAMIDHHATGRASDDMAEIRSHLVSCATICYSMLNAAGFDVNKDSALATALYYGLYMDSNQLSEISHPLDRDMIDFLQYDKGFVARLRYANFSISELETAGIAITNNNYIEKYRAAIVCSEPCDPNILGVISDFVIQVDSIDSCVVYNECQGGYKLSVRSCAVDVAANELADFVSRGIGNGGGHFTKAGGFISRDKFLKECPDGDIEAYFRVRLAEYYEGYDTVSYTDDQGDITKLQRYRKKRGEYGYIVTTDIFPAGTELKLRTLEGDVIATASDDMCIMIGVCGEAYFSERETVNTRYTVTDEPFTKEMEYAPCAIGMNGGGTVQLMPYAKKCISGIGAEIHARPLAKYTKVFTRWDYETYMAGHKGDMLCYANGNGRDVYVVKKDIFELTYEETQ